MGISDFFFHKKYVDSSYRLDDEYSFASLSNIIISSNMRLNIYGTNSDKSLKLFLINPDDVEFIHINFQKKDMNTIEMEISTDKDIKGYFEIYICETASVQIRTDFSDICIFNVISNYLSLYSNAGDISIFDSSIDNCFCRTSSGDISLFVKEDVYKLSLKSKNGDITTKIKNKKSSTKKIICETDYGDIFVDRPKAK